MSSNPDIVRKHGSFSPLVFQVILTEYGKEYDDISDVFFSVKKNYSDPDNEVFFKSQSTGGIIVTGASGDTVVEVAVNWLDTEYSNFILEEIYNAGLFLKFTGDPAADENTEEIFSLKITQDFLQEN